MTRIAIVIGSTRPGRNGPAVARWVLDHLATWPQIEAEIVDVADFDLPFLDEPVPAALSSDYAHDHTRRWAATIRSFDGFIFVTPEYNHSFPAVLKNAIDFLYEEWNDKVAGFVTYGTTGGTRAAEHLRAVLSELRMAHVRSTAALSIFTDFRDMTRLVPQPHQDVALDRMLAELVSWTAALQDLRTRATASNA